MSSTESAQQQGEGDLFEILALLVKKQPVFATCFVALAIYGFSMIMFFQRDSNEKTESWISQEEQKVVKKRVPQKVVQEEPEEPPKKATKSKKKESLIKEAPVVEKVQEPIKDSSSEEEEAPPPVVEKPKKKKPAKKTQKKEEEPKVEKKPEPAPKIVEKIPEPVKEEPPVVKKEEKKVEKKKVAPKKKEEPTKKASNEPKKALDKATNLEQNLRAGVYNMASKAGHDLDWEETTVTKTKKKVQRNPDYDSSDSERFNETLSDWDIDIKQSIATSKSTVCYTAPKKTKKQAQPDPEEYDDEYYEEEEDELVEVDDDGEEVAAPVEVPSPEVKPKVQQAKQGGNLRPGPTKDKPQEPPADKQKRFQKKTNEKGRDSRQRQKN